MALRLKPDFPDAHLSVSRIFKKQERSKRRSQAFQGSAAYLEIAAVGAYNTMIAKVIAANKLELSSIHEKTAPQRASV